MRRVAELVLYTVAGLAIAALFFYGLPFAGTRYAWTKPYVSLALRFAVFACAGILTAVDLRYRRLPGALISFFALVTLLDAYFVAEEAPLSWHEGGMYIGLLLLFYHNAAEFKAAILAMSACAMTILANAFLPHTVAGRWMSLPVLIPIVWLMSLERSNYGSQSSPAKVTTDAGTRSLALPYNQ